MFGKKKPQTVSRPIIQCPVPGCNVVCINEETLKRHTDWAHASAKQTGAPASQGPKN